MYKLKTKSGKEIEFPVFFPVYQPESNLISMQDMKNNYPAKGLIVNGFFLYKKEETKKKLLSGTNLHDFIDFQGIIMTDSGAFQGLKRPLYLSNKDIVLFQDAIGADIISPLDLISPPGDKFQVAKKKLNSTIKRIKKAKDLTQHAILAGVQQGGRFVELRKQSMEALMEIGVEYIAIGSLVPFFNKNHDLSLVIKILKDARSIAGDKLPIHVYGAGDPVELPFLFQLGANIFDSSSYGHYAAGGWYMTPYGSLTIDQKEAFEEYSCNCAVCKKAKNKISVFKDTATLAAHNLHIIFETINEIRKHTQENSMEKYLEKILERHSRWFTESDLKKSWQEHYE